MDPGDASVVAVPAPYCRKGQELAATKRAFSSAMRSIVRPCRIATASDTTEMNTAATATVMSIQ